MTERHLPALAVPAFFAGCLLTIGAPVSAPAGAQASPTAAVEVFNENDFVRVIRLHVEIGLSRYGEGPYLAADRSPYDEAVDADDPELFRFATDLAGLEEMLGGKPRIVAVHYPEDPIRMVGAPAGTGFLGLGRGRRDNAFPYLEVTSGGGKTTFVSCGGLTRSFSFCHQGLQIADGELQVIDLRKKSVFDGISNGISGPPPEMERIPSAFPRCPSDPRCD